MGKTSFSKVKCYDLCPFKFKLRYIDHLETKFDESPTNALHLGTCVHEAIESGDIKKAIDLYKSKYSIWNEDNEIEVLKLQTILPTAISQIPRGEYEYKLDDEDFVGYIDCLVPISEGVYDLLDFKFSNSVSKYRKSGQIHVYKYYYEKLTGNKIRDMYYVMIPKFKEVLSEGYDRSDLEQKIVKNLLNKDIKFEKIEYDQQQVNFFFAQKSIMNNAKFFEKRYNTFCSYCEYAKYCRTNGKDRSELVEKKSEIEEESLF